MNTPFALSKIHHVAYRCRDAKQTVEFYNNVLGMEYLSAFSEDHVPSTGEYDPYMHVFLDAGGGNVIAFFELPNQPDMTRDLNTPEWVQHIAFEVANLETLLAAKAHVEAQGIAVIGPTFHGIFRSIYFFDPNGIRLEFSYQAHDDSDVRVLERWTQTRDEALAELVSLSSDAAWLEKVTAHLPRRVA
mgnify:CR=1 FL=1